MYHIAEPAKPANQSSHFCSHLMTSDGANSILPKLLPPAIPPPTIPCCCMGGSTSDLQLPPVGEGDGGTGGEETGEGLRGR